MLNPQKLVSFRLVCSSFPCTLLKLKFDCVHSTNISPYSTSIRNITRINITAFQKSRSKRILNLVSSKYQSNYETNFIRIRNSSTSVKKADYQGHIRYPKIPVGHLKTMKLESENFKSLFTTEFKILYELFNKYGYELRLAGGPVRDLLAGIKPADLDFASTATPDEMKAMFEKEGIRMINTKGEKHGTITARINDKENYEVTTLRIDVSTDGRHAEVEFTKNWELDAGRRDLTINSMFLDCNGTVYDYFNGTEDLEKKLVRFVGNPSDRMQEDYLRILRYFRFYGRIAPTPNDHEPSTLQAIKDNMSGLSRISGERIWVEMKKILTGNHAAELMLTMMELGIGEHIGLPHDANLEEFKIVMERVKELHLELNPMTIITAFLRTEEEGKALHTRLKLSAFERDLCLFVIEHRGGKGDGSSIQPYQEINLLNNIVTRTLLRAYIEEVLKYNGNVDLLKQFQAWDPPKFPINGHMLMEQNIPAGKYVTLTMLRLKESWIKSDFTLSVDDMLKLVPEIKAELDTIIKPRSPKLSKKQRKV